VFAVGEFRVLFAGLSLFALGFEAEILGLSVLVYARTGSSVWAAAAFSAGFLPQAVGGAFFTSLADRLPPRLVITTGLVVRAAPGLVIGLLPGMPVLVMLLVVVPAAVVMPVFLAGFSGLLPDVLDGDRYILGRSVFTITASATQVLGLGIGGAVLAALPAHWLLLAAGCALTVAAVVSRLGVRPRLPRASRPDARSGPRAGDPRAGGLGGPRVGGLGGPREIVRVTIAGHAELLRIPAVRGLLLAQWFPAWCCTSAEALVVPYADRLAGWSATAGTRPPAAVAARRGGAVRGRGRMRLPARATAGVPGQRPGEDAGPGLRPEHCRPDGWSGPAAVSVRRARRGRWSRGRYRRGGWRERSGRDRTAASAAPAGRQ
jgi:MFS family permease